MNARIPTAFVLAVVLLMSGVSICAAQANRSTAPQGPAPVAIPLTFDHYYTYEQVGEALKALHAAYPSMTTVDVVGQSDEGRDIWAMTVNNPKTGVPSSKPGVYVDANIHGNEIQGGEVCLYLLNELLTRYGQNERITKIVDRNVFYVVPVVNVDGRFHFMTDANTPDSNRSVRVPRDDDRDGLFDEDPPDDLDGDGNITMMRKRDPFGKLKTDPEEPRLMIPVKPGEQGEWTLIGLEGLDNDGDGKVNEDEEGYLDGNRDWGVNWAPPYVQNGAGDYPFVSSTTRAVRDYLVARPNIIVVFAFHNNGGMILRGPSNKAGEPMDPRDIAVFDVIGKNAEKTLPGYRYMVSWKDLYTTWGDFTDFTDNVLGSYGIVGELFADGAEAFKMAGEEGRKPAGDLASMMSGSPEKDRERLLFNDHVVQGDLYKPWKPFKHPQYGDIEIGGWVKLSSRLPHPFMLPDLVHRNAAAVLFAAEQTPDVSVSITSAERVAGDLFKVRVRVANRGGLPSLPYAAVQKKLLPLDRLRVSGAGITVVAGGVLTDPYFEQVTYKPFRPELQMLQVPDYGKVDYQFLVSGKGPLTVSYESAKAGTRSATADLK
jgi:hypothetical protein